jgi:hypothetical protein
MLSNIVGQVDLNAAAVLVAGIVCLCVVITSLIVKRRSRTDVSNEFQLKKMNQESEHQRGLFQLETARAYQFKQLDQNLITSHRENTTKGE